ncbi:Hsp20/alpha crystallin family protein [Halolamina salifodinae]|uniref:HSP20 family molecular chaperone IbpA n=1 Tax=Halolamina salifodinae TaxID=1202767 RepID=A0A8T4GUJ4_9EURY|nr:Hsp20/alpha crystallin family protein [Halolamina salifodinae]MBP1985802.1 HSP20 family molecular chaperone IbpA [Halolamina salifodinae]
METVRQALRELPDAVFADVLESESAYRLVIDLPGATADTVDLRTEGGGLHIEARREKSTPSEFDYVREDRPLFLDAEIPLPSDAGSDAEASMSRGVLTVTVPKRSADPAESIEIDEA